MGDGIDVLHVEDDPDFATLTTDVLASMVEDLSVTTETTVADALARFDAERFDCLVTDYDLPDGTGIDFLEAVRDRDEDVPVLLFTGKGTEAVASDAFSAGATDYLRKGGGTARFKILANRIESAVEAARARTGREQLLSAIETASEGIALLDGDDGEYQFVNQAYADIYGYDPGEMVGEHWSLVYPEEDVDRVAEEILPTVEEAGVWNGTTTGLRADGSTLVEDHTLSLSEKGDLICSVRDVTDRMRQEADLERFRTVVQALGDPVYTVDADECISFVNDAYCEFTGYDRADIVGEHVSAVADEASIERGRAAVRRLLSESDTDQVTYEMTVELADGGTVRCEDNLSLLPMDDGSFRGHAGVVRDISERVEREYELRRYKQMANAAADMVYVLDADGRIEFVNDTATDLTGYDRETLLGSHVDLFMDETDIHRGRELVQRLLAPDGPDSDAYEWTLRRADGRTVPCESHISVVTDEDGVRGTTGVVRDITEQRERERELERTNERLTDFASIVSHDLRNPLEVAQTRLELVEDDSEHHDHVAQALSRMEDIVDDTLALARQGETVDDPRPVDAGNLARNSWSLVETTGADLSVSSFTVDGDTDRLRQVFENLFRNAVEHGSTSPDSQARHDAVEHGSAGSGTGADDAGDATADGVTVTVAPLPDGDGFYVADDGPGIPDDERQHVFDGGNSPGDGRTGFGLSIVRAIVQAHGWEISVTESEAGGARFEVTGVDSLTRE